MLERGTSRTGEPILLLDGKPLHSLYDPVREAQRFVASALAGAPATPVVILLGAALGHLDRAVATRLPGARLVRVALHPRVAELHGDACAEPGWHPGLGASLEAFLAARLDESDLAGMKVLEWAPCTAAWPGQAHEAREAIRSFLRRLRANYDTTAAFGALWLRNAVANFVAVRAVAPPPRAARHEVVVIAASGPSLEDAVPVLCRHRLRFRLWALPSAVAALAAEGLAPDLVVLTDPGLYAAQHLPAGRTLPIAMPLSAARGAWRVADAVRLFAQPYLIETELAGQLASWSLALIPPQGTVAASALQLAAAAGYRSIVFAGLDFCFRDVLSHARPGLFETYHATRAARLAPFDGALYGSAADAADGGDGRRASAALAAYAAWFAAAPLPAGIRAYRLLPSAVRLPALASLREGELPALLPPAAPPAAPPVPTRPPADRVDRVAAALARWRLELERSRDRRPADWSPLARELALFLDLAGYARARSGAAPGASAIETAIDRLDALRGRIPAPDLGLSR